MNAETVWKINEIFYFSWAIGMALIIGIEFQSEGKNRWFNLIKRLVKRV